MKKELTEIMKILPHRYPFLFIDKVTELVPGKTVKALKNLSINDWFFSGHFPGRPIMPGTLIIEAMAQTSILLYHSTYEDKLQSIPDYYLGSIKARFMHPAYPGDQMKITAQTVKILPNVAYVAAKAAVKDTEIAEADLIFAVKQ